ncbi:MAG: EAL domain-containing protein, partial [Gammaproteobacteria bacterium]
TRLLLPGVFAPVAAEQIGLPKPDSVQALVFTRPADPRAVLASFGVLGTAEAGAHIAATASPLLTEHDLATRIGDSNILALVARPDEAEVERWTNSLLHSLGQGIFEGGGHSAHLDFVAGYALIDRVRRLDALIRQAQKAADDAAPGTISRGNDGTATVAIDDDSWEPLIREALESHRYKVALLPIEDLASGARFWATLPRVLDRGGHEIVADLFQPPAKRLGLLPILERRLVGHALRALLSKSGNRKSARVIVPLHATTLADEQFFDFLKDLLGHTSNPPAPKSLVLELDINQISNRIREAEQFAEQASTYDCGLGLRGYAPEAASKSVEVLPVESLRMTPTVAERLADEDDETMATAVKAAVARLETRGIQLIASGVADTNTMAKLYNLGVGTVEGPAIGEPELFRAD